MFCADVATPFNVNVPLPFASVTGVLNPVLTRTVPFVPAAPGWMWAARMTVPLGKLFIETLKSMVFESEWMVMTAVPRPLDSAFATGGTSFDGSRFTVKTFVVDGLVELLLPQPATARAAA